jgi:hypothetical protein
VVYEVVDNVSADNVFFNDTLYVLNGALSVENALGINDNDRSKLAKSEATGTNYLSFVLNSESLDLCIELVDKLVGTGRSTTGTAANEDLVLVNGFILTYVSVAHTDLRKSCRLYFLKFF